jgi:hypothetical protein
VLLSDRIESIEYLWSKSFSRGSFPNTPTSCSVKYLRGYKLFLTRFFSSISHKALLAPFRVSAVVPSLVLRTDS